MRIFIEKYLLIIAMVIGITFHKQLFVLNPAVPYLLSLMLFVTYCRVSWSNIKFTKFHYMLLGIQYLGSAIVYLVLRPFNEILAQAVMICILTATATSAPVVTGILGGNIASVAAYTIVSNLLVAFIAPLFLSAIGSANESVPFFASFWYIFQKVMPVLLVPFVLSLLLGKVLPKVHNKIRSAQSVSFYLWAVTLTIVLGNVTQFVLAHNDGNYTLELSIAALTLLTCLMQFFFGRRIGSRFNYKVAGGQSLGQKNTVLAIWLTQTYLNPVASLGPGLYVLWQNLVNSWQIWKKKREEEKESV